MHPALSLNTLSCGSIDLAAAAAMTNRLELGRISPTLEDLDPFGAAGARKILDGMRLSVATLTHRSFAFDTPKNATKARTRLFAKIDAAADLGAGS